MSALRTSLGICVAFALFSASCKPDRQQPSPKDLGLKTDVPEAELPIVDGVFGALYSLKIYETENGNKVKSESATAEFYDVPSNTSTATQGTYVGEIFINNYNLTISENNEYIRVNTEGNVLEDLNYEDGVSWSISGDDGFPQADFSWTAKFPKYTGYFPGVIERNKDLTFTFDLSSTVSAFTDSVFVVIAAGDKKIVKRYGCSEGKVTIPSSDLAPLQACSMENPGYLQISTSVVDIFHLPNGNPIVLVKQESDTRPVVIQ